jgi:hypothetical protein
MFDNTIILNFPGNRIILANLFNAKLKSKIDRRKQKKFEKSLEIYQCFCGLFKAIKNFLKKKYT